MAARGVWLLTRPGFEHEASREWLEGAESLGIHACCRPLAGLGLTYCELPGRPGEARRVRERLTVDSLVFTRDAVFELRRIQPLPKDDRVGALLDAMDDLPAQQWGEMLVHVPEGSEDRDLAAFARKWTAAAAAALRRRQWLAAERNDRDRRLDLVLPDFDTLVIGQSFPGHRAVFPGGRPRLRLATGAPSRSTLKLEEAFLTLLTTEERERLLAPGMTAVDLGAAPGGWTHHLVGRGMIVTAVDNGPIDEGLMRSGRVEHLRADGFTWLPDQPCDWMVCDIVDKPRRTIDLVDRWLGGGHCRASVFNLKLPMKKRLDEWHSCRERLESALARSRRSLEIRAKQLYHDREEITVVVVPRG